MPFNKKEKKMKKYTFMIKGYEDYIPSDYECLYDEDRLWELSYDVIANSKLEAMNSLFKDCHREVIDEDSVFIQRIFGSEDCEYATNHTYLIVGIEDVRLGVDFVKEDIRITKKTLSEKKWCSDGTERVRTYFFDDGFSIKEIYRGAPGWSESETLLVNPSNKYYTLHTHGEDTYNQGNKSINACQSPRFKAISEYERLEEMTKRRFKASMLNATQTSRQTFLDREMPYLVA